MKSIMSKPNSMNTQWNDLEMYANLKKKEGNEISALGNMRMLEWGNEMLMMLILMLGGTYMPVTTS